MNISLHHARSLEISHACDSEETPQERTARYANAANRYARQLSELYCGLLDAPLRKADVATAARMTSLTHELVTMTMLVMEALKKQEIKS